MKYIGIDIGSSFIKSVLLDMDSGVAIALKSSAAPQKKTLPDKKCFEIPASGIVTIVKEIIDGYTKDYTNIEGVILATQMHGFIYHAEGYEDTYISWQDMRCLNPISENSTSFMEYLQGFFSKEEMKTCGIYIKPSLGLCNLYTLLQSDTTIPRNGELFTLGSYIINDLAGNNLCHATNAAPLGLLNVQDGVWDRKIIAKAGFGEITFPALAKNDFENCGIYVSHNQKLQIYPDFGDQQTSVLGCLPEKDDVIINIATGSQVIQPVDIFKPGQYETRPYFGKKFINTISNMPAGRNLDVLIQFLQNAILQITGQRTEADNIWNAIHRDFHFEKEGIRVNMGFYSTPDNMQGGAIAGINQYNLVLNNLFSAAFENMAATYWKNIEILCKGVQSIRKIICAGGVSWKTPELIETIQRISGHQTVLSTIPDESLSGFYRLALVCSGICQDLSDKKEMILKMKES
jgi:sugar (pentulose or hexulose) kinase